MKKGKILATILIIIGSILVIHYFLRPKETNDVSTKNNLVGQEVSNSILQEIVEIANLDSEEYPLTPFGKSTKIKEYTNEEKDNIIIYYAKRKNIAKKYNNDDIELCKVTNKCYSIEESEYKKILKTYELIDYEHVYLQKNDNMYYFIHEKIPMNGKVSHNVKATYGENNTIIAVDNIKYDELGLGYTEKEIRYMFNVENNTISLIEIIE